MLAGSKHDGLNTNTDKQIVKIVQYAYLISVALSRIRGDIIIHDGVDKDGASVDAACSSQMGRQRVRMDNLVQRSSQLSSIDGLKPRPGPVIHHSGHDLVAHTEEPCGRSYLGRV